MSPEASTSRYFTLTDDKSNKFWQITVAEYSYTVAYGRIGTAGQSLQKIYDTADQCRMEADKIIQEKIAKGYSEEGGAAGAFAAEIPKSRVGARSANADKEAEEATLRAYQELIGKGSTNDLLPFLQSVNRAHYPALRKAIKSARKHYCESRTEVIPGTQGNSWRSVRNGTDEQCLIIELSGMALLPASELKLFFLMRYFNDSQPKELVERILDWARPAWLTDFLNTETRSNGWGAVEYRVLRRWEDKGYVDYLPELFVRSMSRCREHTGNHDQTGSRQRYTDYLCNDEKAYTRDVLLLVEYETEMHMIDYSFDPKTKTTITLPSVWQSILIRLVKEGKLDRQWLIEACISVQSKDWNANLRSFFRKQVEEMEVTTEELITIQSSLFHLLGAQHPHVVNWAVAWIKSIAASPEFDKATLLEWAPTVMMRSDCKTAVKTLLAVLEKGMKKGASDNSDILTVAIDVFAQADLALQTKVASLIKKYGSTNDENLRDKLQLYSEQMLGTIRQELQDFIAVPEATADVALTEKPAYTYAPAPPPLLNDLEEVVLPQTWNDWLFAVGKYLGSDDVLDMEILVNACIIPPPDTPTDGEQLLPYVKQLQVADASCVRTFTANWLLQVLQDPKQPFDQEKWQGDYETLRLHVKRLQHAQRKMQADSKLPLLSFPSHKPYYIAPAVLVDRLIRYRKAGEEIDILDLTIALSRTITDSAAEALQAADQLDEPLKNLIRFALTGKGEPVPKKEGGLFKTIAKGLGLSKRKTKCTWRWPTSRQRVHVSQTPYLKAWQNPNLQNARMWYARWCLHGSRAEIIEEALFSYQLNNKQHYKSSGVVLDRNTAFPIMERIAFVMEVLGRNFITDTELRAIVPFQADFEKCKYLPAFWRDSTKDEWSFEHNNIQEFLAANVLIREPFVQIVDVISIPFAGERRIKPTWVNTISFLISIGQESPDIVSNLLQWIVQNDVEILVRFEPDRIDLDRRIDVFKRIFNFYSDKGIWLRSNKFTDVELARFAKSEEIVRFLVAEIESNPHNRIKALNAFRILDRIQIGEYPDYVPRIQTALECLLVQFKSNPEDVYSILAAAARMKIANRQLVELVVAEFGNHLSQYLRAGLYKLISSSPFLSEYISVFLDGLNLGELGSAINDRGNFSLLDESYALMAGLRKPTDGPTLTKIIRALNHGQVNLYNDDYSKVLTSVIQNSIDAFSVYQDYLRRWLILL